MKVHKEILLTFDVEGPPQREDFLDNESLQALHRVLELLKNYDLKGVFFITGSVAKSLSKHPKVLELLQSHEIGYHSTVHSANPKIFEYTDIESYESAVETSRQRETFEVNPYTGKPGGKGGILALQEIFPQKKIRAFRAPFLCWSPPHLEALREVGVRFDFSSCMSRTPVLHKRINFMPYPVVIDSILSNLHILAKKIMDESNLVLLAHPSRARARSRLAVEFKFFQFKRFLGLLRLLEKGRLIEIQSGLTESNESLSARDVDVTRVYDTSMWAARNLFNYEPKFILSHFYRFINE